MARKVPVTVEIWSAPSDKGITALVLVKGLEKHKPKISHHPKRQEKR